MLKARGDQALTPTSARAPRVLYHPGRVQHRAPAGRPSLLPLGPQSHISRPTVGQRGSRHRSHGAGGRPTQGHLAGEGQPVWWQEGHGGGGENVTL